MSSPKVLQLPTARVFAPLLKPARYKGIYSGRGAGKSHYFAEAAIELCLEKPGTRIVCVREVQRSLKESVKRLIEDKIITFKLGGSFHVLTDSIVTPNNGVILFQGMQDHTAESIKSLEGFSIAYVEEAQMLTDRSLEMLRPTIRESGSELWFSWNPRHASDPVDKLLRCETPPKNSIVVKTSYLDNPWFPKELEEERLFDIEHNPSRYSHVWLGEYEPSAIGAIWNREIIHRNRRHQAPKLTRILVSVDPAVTSEEGSDYTGIIVTALGEDGRGYVIDDFSCKGTPQQWAERAVAAYDLHEADAVVAEVNQGGDMVEHTIHSVRRSVKVIKVRATRGKHIRAEPISALYALDKISHVGSYPELEGQLCLLTPSGYDGEGSPDRADALVWGFTELFPRLTPRGRVDKSLPSRANSQYRPHRVHEKRT